MLQLQRRKTYVHVHGLVAPVVACGSGSGSRAISMCLSYSRLLLRAECAVLVLVLVRFARKDLRCVRLMLLLHVMPEIL